MKTRLLRDIEVSAVGIGCMGFHHGYGPAPDREEAVRLIRYAVELGCTHFDTAEGYGRGHNELLVGEALRPVRDQVVIATKLHVNQSTSDNPIEKQVRKHLEASLTRLGTDHVELYYLHRINPAVPVGKTSPNPWASSSAKEKFAVGANHNPPPTKFAARMP
jgi:aryl-alcohol dehydrogenase-like predicted oxidoreductase